MDSGKKLVPAIAGVVLAGFLGLILLIGGTDEPLDNGCTPGGTSLNVAGVPSHKIGQWDTDQVRNAAAIINAGAKLGVPARGQQIAVMTAIGESTLVVVDHGDDAGPDSRGLFQQRARGWGSYSDRMNPTISATNFYKALLKVSGWESMEPTIAAHKTQHNADAYHYAKFWRPAVDLVNALVSGEGQDVARNVAASGGLPLGANTMECGANSSVFGLNPGGYVGPYPPAELMARAKAYVDAGDRDPFFGDGGGWYRKCQHFVANMSGRANSGYDTAADAWSHFVASGVAHPANGVDGNAPPVGAWLYYSGAGAAGHVAIYLGNGMVAGNDTWGSGRIGIGPATDITEDKWHLNYLGWAAPWGAKVPVRQPGAAAAPAAAVVPAQGGGSNAGGVITVASFNVLGQYHTGPGGDQHPSWATGEARMPATAKILTNSGATVAGLQELEAPQAKAFNAVAGGTWIGWYPGTDTRNAIVWRKDTWSLVSTAALPIPYINRDLPMPAVLLQMRSTGQRVWFFNVHNPSNMYGVFGNQRAVALGREVTAVKRLLATGVPVVMTGDFNQVHEPICAMHGLLENAFAPRQSGCAPGRGEGIDHIFGPRNAKYLGTYMDSTPQRLKVADHPLVYTKFQLG